MNKKIKKILGFCNVAVIVFLFYLIVPKTIQAEDLGSDPEAFSGAISIGNYTWHKPKTTEIHNVYLNDAGSFEEENPDAGVPERGPAYITLNQAYKTRMDETLGYYGGVSGPGNIIYYYFTLEKPAKVSIYGQCSTASNSKLSIEKIDNKDTFAPSTDPFGAVLNSDAVKCLSTYLSEGDYLICLFWGSEAPKSAGECYSYVKVSAEYSINQETDDEWYETFPNNHLHYDSRSEKDCVFISTPYKIGKKITGYTSVGNIDSTMNYYTGWYSFTISEKSTLSFESIDNILSAYVVMPKGVNYKDHHNNDNKISNLGKTMVLEPGDYIILVEAKSKGEYSFSTSMSSTPSASAKAGVDTMEVSGWNVSNDTVTIDSLNINSGEFCIYSGDVDAGYGKGLAKLVIKGNCYIKTLVIDCNVEVKCELGSKLVVGNLVINTDYGACGKIIYSDGTTYNEASKTFEESSVNKDPEHEHVWNDGEITKKPTYTEKGIKTFKCTISGCNKTRIEEIDMLVNLEKEEEKEPIHLHEWDDGVVTKEPTYTEKGIKTYTCKLDSSHIKTVEIPTLEKLGDVIAEDADVFTEEELSLDKIKIVGINDAEYTGANITFDTRVYKGTRLLIEGIDYTLKYSNNKLACTDLSSSIAPTVTFIGKGEYKNEVLEPVKFKISPIDISNLKASNDTVVFVNKQYKPVPILTLNGKKLNANKDYEVIYDDKHKDGFLEIGTYAITLKGINNYSGSVTSIFKMVDSKKYTIMSKASVSGYESSFKYDGTAKVQNPAKLTVKIGSDVLKLNTDYTVECINNIEPGIASMIIKAVEGSDKYVGEKVINYKIIGTPISKAKVTFDSSFDNKNIFYTGKTIKPPVSLALKDGKKLIEGTDYTISYQKNVNIGTAVIIIEGKGAYSGTVKKAFKIKPVVITNNSNIIAKTVGNAKKNTNGKYEIEIAVYNNEKPLIKDSDYIVSFKNNTKKGTAKAIIKGKGNYTKSITVTFEITE